MGLEGLSWLERSDWLNGLGSGIPGLNLMPTLGVDMGQRIALLEAEGVTLSDFMAAWESLCRRQFRVDPSFSGNFLSGSAWGLAQVRPAWKNALHDRLVDSFLSPWLEAFYDHFGNPEDASVHLRWKGCTRHCNLTEARQWLRVKGLIPELNFHHDLAPSVRVLEWSEAPPVELMLSGPVQEIRALSRPAVLILQECPDLVRIGAMETEHLHVSHAPKLELVGAWTESTKVRHFTWG